MRRTLYTMCASLFLASSALADPCSPDDARMQKCIRETITSDNIVIGGWFSDVGGKTKDATLACGYECNKNLTDFNKKWGEKLMQVQAQ